MSPDPQPQPGADTATSPGGTPQINELANAKLPPVAGLPDEPNVPSAAQSLTYRHMNYKLESGVATITLNRPQVLNSLNATMCAELFSSLQTAARDPQVRVIVLTGAGKGFCAGQDLAAVPDLQAPGLDLGKVLRDNFNPIVLEIRKCPKPVVCLVNGVAAGVGSSLALCCDLVVASKDAAFIQSFGQVGLIPDGGATYLVPRLVGLSKANAMFMLTEKVSAEDAANCGLIYKAVPADQLQSAGESLTKDLCQRSAVSMALTKQAINASLFHGLDEQLELEATLQGQAGRSADFREGVAAFTEKRKPKFS